MGWPLSGATASCDCYCEGGGAPKRHCSWSARGKLLTKFALSRMAIFGSSLSSVQVLEFGSGLGNLNVNFLGSAFRRERSTPLSRSVCPISCESRVGKCWCAFGDAGSGLAAIRSHGKMRLQMRRRLCNQATLLLECPGKVVSNFRPFRLELFSPGACVRIWHRHPNVNFLESARRPDDTERRGELGGARSSRRVGAHRQKTPHSDLSLLVCCGGHVGACVARPTQDW